MAPRKLSLTRLMLKRQNEDNALRDALFELKAQRDVIDTQIREVEALLGGKSAFPSMYHTAEAGDIVTCADCGARVAKPADTGERGSKCPVCASSPFEEKD